MTGTQLGGKLNQHGLSGEGFHDPARSLHRCFVLPDPDDGPSGGAERSIIEPITLFVSRDLGAPIRSIGSGSRPVLWTPVPEAAIDKDGNPLATKHEVSPATQTLDWPRVHAVSKATAMKLRAEGELRTSVALAVALHRCSDGGRGGRRGFWNDSRGPVAARSIGGSF